MKPVIQAALSLCLGLCLVLATLPRTAAAQTPEQRLETLFDQYLNVVKMNAKLKGDELRTEGKITVQKSGAYYAVTLPHISYHEPDGAYTDLGIPAINALPGDTPGTWKMSVAMPSPVMSYDAQKQPAQKISAGKQIVNGIWDEALDGFSKLDARYQDITYENYATGIKAKAPSTSVVYDFTKTGTTWSGNIDYALNGMTGTLDQKTETGTTPLPFKLDQLALNATLRDYNPEIAKSYRTKIQDIASRRASNDAPNIVNESDIQLGVDAFTDLISNALGEFKQNLRVSGFEIKLPPGEGPARSINLASADISLGGNNLRTDKANLNLDLNYAGLETSPTDMLFPDRTKIDLDLSNLPLTEVSKLLRKAATEKSSGAAPGTTGLDALTLFKAAGTILKLNPSTLANAHYTVDGNGLTTISTTSPSGIEGSTTIDIRGIDAVIKLAQGKVTDKSVDAASKMHYTRMAMALATLKMVGQQTPGDKDKRTYVLDMTPDGKFLINGSDISMLKELISKSKADPAPKSP